MRQCSFEGCGRRHAAKGYCSTHWRQDRKGQALKPINSGLSDAERFALYIQKSDGCWTWSGHLLPPGYAKFGQGGKLHAVHRYAYELWVGPIPAGHEIDHRCHNRACVNPTHLRIVTRKQNCENAAGAQRNSGTGVRGVEYRKAKGRYRAYAVHDGTNTHLGYFDTLEGAEAAAIAGRNERFTHNDVDRRTA